MKLKSKNKYLFQKWNFDLPVWVLHGSSENNNKANDEKLDDKGIKA